MKKNKYKVYFASGWFSPEQFSTYETTHKTLDNYSDLLEVYYPKEKFQIQSNTLTSKETRNRVFQDNLIAIMESDVIVCSTEGKDMGSIFEAGYAHSNNIPIVYVCFFLGDKPLNLMLQESSIAVATTPEKLIEILDAIKEKGLDYEYFESLNYNGKTE
jgi:nucleoside 2-deoxyribosyltransferase